MNAGLLLFIILVGLSFLGVPIFLSTGIATIISIAYAGFPLETVVQKALLGLNAPALLAIPLFMLAGSIMAKGITGKLINISNALLGRLRGSLGAVTVLASALFGAISGSALATVSAIGGTLIPSMKSEGYDDAYAGAISSSSSILGTLVPPSVTLIIYASLTDTSVRKLFSATVVPAIITATAFVIYALYYGRKNNLPAQKKYSGREVLHTFKEGFWAILMPVFVLGTIFGGICTATEAAAISVLYALIVNIFVYKGIKAKDIFPLVKEAAIGSATIMVIIAFSKAAAYLVVTSQLPQMTLAFINSFTSSKFVVLLLINIILLILGCVMEGSSVLVMMVPLLLPLAKAYQVDLIQFGILVGMNIYLGSLTPPVGISLLMGAKMASCSLKDTMKKAAPFFAIATVVLLMITYWPTFSLWLPSLMK